jgi:hypothetical protein
VEEIRIKKYNNIIDQRNEIKERNKQKNSKNYDKRTEKYNEHNCEAANIIREHLSRHITNARNN